MNGIKYAVCFVAGAAAGVLATRSYFDKKYAERADKEIDAAMDDMHNKLDRFLSGDETEDKTEESVEESIDEEHEAYLKGMEELYSEAEEPKAPINYNKASSVVEKLVVEEKPEDDIPVGVYPIDAEAFITEGGKDKVALEYYVDDETLANAIDDAMVDAHTTVGEMNLKDFASSNLTEMYFRNNNNNTDYEIVKNFGSYREHIGEGEW